MAERVLMKGNEAIAEAAIRAGCRHYFGYPITPQTEIAAYMAKKMPKIGGVFLQAESEIASINMVYGAAAAGMRVMTSSSSPGISLKAEGLSYIAGSDVPALVVNVQRGGPGLGGIQPSQSDYFQATKGGAHGDFHMIVLAPASVQEMAELTVHGFALADQYRMTTMILADGTMGQMMEPVSLDFAVSEAPEKPWAVTGTKMERKHNIINSLYLQPQELEDKVVERYKRYEDIKAKHTMAVADYCDDADIVVVAYGKILPAYILDYPKYGCINVHGSLLPKYRGAAPVQRCIMDGEAITGVTLMYMEEGLDTGDMLLVRETEIGENETAEELFDRLAVIGGEDAEVRAVPDKSCSRKTHGVERDGYSVLYEDSVSSS